MNVSASLHVIVLVVVVDPISFEGMFDYVEEVLSRFMVSCPCWQSKKNSQSNSGFLSGSLYGTMSLISNDAMEAPFILVQVSVCGRNYHFLERQKFPEI